jgi:hypothetical protein
MQRTKHLRLIPFYIGHFQSRPGSSDNLIGVERAKGRKNTDALPTVFIYFYLLPSSEEK